MLSQLRDRGVQSTALLRSSGTVIRCFARLEITLTGETNDCGGVPLQSGDLLLTEILV
jgi:hypothetical protein